MASEQVDLISLFRRLVSLGPMLYMLVADRGSWRRTLARLLIVGCGLRRSHRRKAAEYDADRRRIRFLTCLSQRKVVDLTDRSAGMRTVRGCITRIMRPPRPLGRTVGKSLPRRIVVIANLSELSLSSLQLSKLRIRIWFVDKLFQGGRLTGTLLESSRAAEPTSACSPVSVLHAPIAVRQYRMWVMRMLLDADRGRPSWLWRRRRGNIPRSRRSRHVNGGCPMLWLGGQGQTGIDCRPKLWPWPHHHSGTWLSLHDALEGLAEDIAFGFH